MSNLPVVRNNSVCKYTVNTDYHSPFYVFRIRSSKVGPGDFCICSGVLYLL